MKQIPLTQGRFAIVDDDDYDFLIQRKWHVSTGYACNGANPKIMMHRLINKTPEGFDTDHINENRLDNRKENLRTATRSQNQMNKGKQKNNKSGVRGVGWHKVVKAWGVNIGIDGKSVHVGYFETKELAEKAYKKVAHFLYGDFVHGGVSLK